MVDNAESTNPIVQRSSVHKKDYRDYREDLRIDFFFSCAYCSIMEREANAIRFEIDHYWPQKHFPNLIAQYDNLMWSCEHCNGRKRGFFPNGKDMESGHSIIKIDEEYPDFHLELNGVRLISKTHKGQFNIEMLDLNRQSLRRLREIRKRSLESMEFIKFGIQRLNSIKVDRVRPKERLAFLKARKQIIEMAGKYPDEENVDLRLFAKSELIDIDPDRMEKNKRRREYLKKVGVILNKK
ncbi:MAG: HNH endonuclease [Desulfococcaceae bacterium]